MVHSPDLCAVDHPLSAAQLRPAPSRPWRRRCTAMVVIQIGAERGRTGCLMTTVDRLSIVLTIEQPRYARIHHSTCYPVSARRLVRSRRGCFVPCFVDQDILLTKPERLVHGKLSLPCTNWLRFRMAWPVRDGRGKNIASSARRAKVNLL